MLEASKQLQEYEEEHPYTKPVNAPKMKKEKKKYINVVIVENNSQIITLHKTKIEDKLDVFYKIIGCDLIDIQTRKINGRYYNIIFDEEFLCKSKPMPTMWERFKREVLCGNLIICPLNEEQPEELGSFTDAEATRLCMQLIKSNTYDF